MKTFTIDELSKYDGKEERRCCFAFQGKVFDASDSFLWKGGKHQAIHYAGRNLTMELAAAPHGKDLLARVKCICSVQNRGDEIVRKHFR